GTVAAAAGGGDGSSPAPPSITQLVSHVPATTLDAVGAGPIKHSVRHQFTITKLGGAPYGIAKAVVLSGDLAWCPHCAASNWALAVAVSRFGSFSSLRLIDTGTYYAQVIGAHPAYSHTQGLSFYGVHYSSPLLSFQNLVIQNVTGGNLQEPNGQQLKQIYSFDKHGIFPLVDIGDDYGFVGSAFSPAVIHGRSALQIAESLGSPGSKIARAIDGLANVYTAAICNATK